MLSDNPGSVHVLVHCKGCWKGLRSGFCAGYTKSEKTKKQSPWSSVQLSQPFSNCCHIFGSTPLSKNIRIINLSIKDNKGCSIKIHAISLLICVVITAVAPESHLVSGGSDNRLIIWEAQNGKVSCPFHQTPVPDSRFPVPSYRYVLKCALLFLVHSVTGV